MPEYIERKALIKKISSISIKIMGARLSGKTLFLNALNSYAETVLQSIRQAPAADVEKVVRCGQCKYFHEYPYRVTNTPSGWGKCKKIGMDIDLAKNDFCSYGERKGD